MFASLSYIPTHMTCVLVMLINFCGQILLPLRNSVKRICELAVPSSLLLTLFISLALSQQPQQLRYYGFFSLCMFVWCRFPHIVNIAIQVAVMT
jgi:hypothetical protein